MQAPSDPHFVAHTFHHIETFYGIDLCFALKTLIILMGVYRTTDPPQHSRHPQWRDDRSWGCIASRLKRSRGCWWFVDHETKVLFVGAILNRGKVLKVPITLPTSFVTRQNQRFSLCRLMCGKRYWFAAFISASGRWHRFMLTKGGMVHHGINRSQWDSDLVGLFGTLENIGINLNVGA